MLYDMGANGNSCASGAKPRLRRHSARSMEGSLTAPRSRPWRASCASSAEEAGTENSERSKDGTQICGEGGGGDGGGRGWVGGHGAAKSVAYESLNRHSWPIFE